MPSSSTPPSEVRATGASLARGAGATILPCDAGRGQILDAAFDLTPSVEAAAGWTDRALAAADRIRERLSSSDR